MLPRCILLGCQKHAETRGCCSEHYNKFLRAVRAGVITWAELEKAGKSLPSKAVRCSGFRPA